MNRLMLSSPSPRVRGVETTVCAFLHARRERRRRFVLFSARAGSGTTVRAFLPLPACGEWRRRFVPFSVHAGSGTTVRAFLPLPACGENCWHRRELTQCQFELSQQWVRGRRADACTMKPHRRSGQHHARSRRANDPSLTRPAPKSDRRRDAPLVSPTRPQARRLQVPQTGSDRPLLRRLRLRGETTDR